MSDAPKSSPTGKPSAGTPAAGKNPPASPPTQPTPTAASNGRGGSGRTWLFAGLIFLVGLVIGGLAIGLARPGGTSTAAPTATVTVTPSATPTSTSRGTQPDTVATVRVPAACIKVADDSKKVADLANQAVSAALDLDAAKLSDLVRQMGEAQNILTQDGDACREVKATVTATPGSYTSSRTSSSTTSPSSSTSAP